jgi:hypothetical protein
MEPANGVTDRKPWRKHPFIAESHLVAVEDVDIGHSPSSQILRTIREHHECRDLSKPSYGGLSKS